MADITNDFSVTDIDLLKAAESTQDPIEQNTKAHQSVLRQELLWLLKEKYSNLMAGEIASVFVDIIHVMQTDEERIIKNLTGGE